MSAKLHSFTQYSINQIPENPVDSYEELGKQIHQDIKKKLESKMPKDD